MNVRRLAAPALVALAACADDPTTTPDTRDTTVAIDDTSVATDATTAPDTSAPDTTATDDTSGDTADTWVAPPDRAPGERASRLARCDDLEPARCLLPWPSNAFLAADATTATGLRLALPDDVLPADEGLDLLGGDGFSRVTPVVALLPLDAAPGTGRLRLFRAEPGPEFGAEIAVANVRFEGRDTTDADVLVAYPLAPLAADSEHLAVLDGVRVAGDAAMQASPLTRVALGLTAPTTPDEAATRAYFAPARAVLAARGIDPTTVARAWDFTTRSAEDPLRPLRDLAAAARAAVVDGSATVVVDGLAAGEGPIAAIVRGHIAGLPDATLGGDGRFAVPFRVVVPTGAGDYRVVMYSHGTGGDVSDTAFDGLVAESGAAKVNVEIDGWTGDTVAEAVAGLLVPLVGTRDLVARMRRALAGIAAIQAALIGPLGDRLAAATLADAPNPTAGRRPRRTPDGLALDLPVWAGGSLGGVVGLVYGHLEPTIVGGVLNVPGAGFTHWLGQSALSDILSIALTSRYPAMVDQQLAAAMSQALWDEVDGAAWAGQRAVAPVFLVQMSVGDPVMPNLATALVATSLDALALTPPDEPLLVPVAGLTAATEAVGRSALTEFRTDATSNSGIHGFAATDRPAGIAARAQFAAFIATLWAGAPRITIPDDCMALDPPGVCDFADGAPRPGGP